MTTKVNKRKIGDKKKNKNKKDVKKVTCYNYDNYDKKEHYSNNCSKFPKSKN